jgi:hypothetical protein
MCSGVAQLYYAACSFRYHLTVDNDYSVKGNLALVPQRTPRYLYSAFKKRYIITTKRCRHWD